MWTDNLSSLSTRRRPFHRPHSNQLLRDIKLLRYPTYKDAELGSHPKSKLSASFCSWSFRFPAMILLVTVRLERSMSSNASFFSGQSPPNSLWWTPLQKMAYCLLRFCGISHRWSWLLLPGCEKPGEKSSLGLQPNEQTTSGPSLCLSPVLLLITFVILKHSDLHTLSTQF